MSRSLIPLKISESYDGYEVGGKARNLFKLLRAGLPVPEGWIIPAEEFIDHLIASDLAESAHAIFTDGEVARCSDLHKSILGVDLQPRLLQALSNLPTGSLAVRSSASVEDGALGSYSGLFSTFLGVDTNHLQDAVKGVWASVFAPEVLSYHRQITSGSDNYPAMSVLIMPLLDAHLSGVAFSADPSDGNPFRICISTCWGLGTRIVDGSEDGSSYTLDLDTLDTVAVSIGNQSKGDFLQSDGRVTARAVGADVSLSQDQLRELGQAVRRIDATLDARVDVEFAFTDCTLMILQAREILRLPPFFPDDPRETSDQCGIRHHTSTDPLKPLVRDLITRPIQHPQIPTPPWPMESMLISCVHGRAFGHWPPEPPLIRTRGEAFLRKMENWDDPEEHFFAYHEWTKNACERVLPPIRQSCARLLALSKDELAELASSRMIALFREALDLEYQGHVFYLSPSWTTSHYVEMTETLLQSWLSFPKPPPRVYSTPAEQLAMEMIQGAPTLTHARDIELQQVALGSGNLDEFICRWGYSYIIRDEHIYLDRWKSWREDPRPLRQAIEQMQRAVDQRPLTARLVESRAKADETLSLTLQRLATADQDRSTKRARLLAACVHFGRVHFRWKDDRDLVWSLTQATLRWILLEVARRLVAAGAVTKIDDVFLFDVKELYSFLGGSDSRGDEFSDIAEQRRCDQIRLNRYTLAVRPGAESPAPPEGGVMIGIPTGNGIAEGKAHIVRDASALADLADLEEGDILVLIGEGKIGLTMFFPQIAGLVYSSGNGFSHEVNILRELGKPAIVSVGENAALIEEGEPLRIDATKGTVTRLQQVG